MLESLFSLTKTLSDHLPQIWSWHLPLIWPLQLLMPSMTNAMLKHGLKSGSVPVTCESVGTDMQCPQLRRKIQPLHLQEFVVNCQTGSKEPLETSDDYQFHCFFPVIDRLIKLNASESCHILNGAAAVNPKTFIDKDALLPMAKHYGVLEVNLAAERHQQNNLLSGKNKVGTLSAPSMIHDPCWYY